MDPSRETLDGLRRVGFRLNMGIDDTGILLLLWSKASGYYLGSNFHPHHFFDMSSDTG